MQQKNKIYTHAAVVLDLVEPGSGSNKICKQFDDNFCNHAVKTRISITTALIFVSYYIFKANHFEGSTYLTRVTGIITPKLE